MLDRTDSQLVTHSGYMPRDPMMSDTPETGPSVDFGFVFRVIRRRAKLIALFVVLAVSVAAVTVLFDYPLYSSSTRIIVERRSIDILGTAAVTTDPALNPAEADGQLQVIRSDKIIGMMIEDLQLLSNPAFTEPFSHSTPQRIRQSVVGLLSDLGILPDLQAALAPAVAQEVQLPEAIGLIEKRLDVRRVGLSYVFEINVAWTNPVLAAQMADGIAAAYVRDRADLLSGETEAAIDWLDARLVLLRDSADAAEAEVARFRIANNIVEAGREGLLNEQQLSALSTQLSEAVSQSLTAQQEMSRFSQVAQQDLSTAPIGDTAAERQLRLMRDELVELEDRRADSVQLVGADDPATLAIVQQLVRLNQRILAEITRVEATFAQAYQAAQIKEQDVRDSLQAITAQSVNISAAQVKLQALQSEAAVHRQLYDSYLQLYMQTVQQQSLPIADVRVISPAVIAEHDNTDGSRTAIVALAVGASLGLAAALLVERLDRSVRTPWQLRLATGTPTIGLLPKVTAPGRSKPTLLPPGQMLLAPNQFRIDGTVFGTVVSAPTSQFTQAVRRIKVAVDNSAQPKLIPVIGFISDEDIASRGLVAANYAQLLATYGQKVLLVDLDFGSARLTRALAPAAQVGIANFAVPATSAELEAAIWKDPVGGLAFMPSRPLRDLAAANGASLNSDRLVRVLDQLTAHFDCLVLDLASLKVSADAAALSDTVSGYVLVSEWGTTSSDTVARYTSDAGFPSHKLLGSVLADVDPVKYARYEAA